MAAMRSPMMPTSPRNHGAPVPSTMRPLVIKTSNACGAADAGDAGDAGDVGEVWHAANSNNAHAATAIGFSGIRESYVESVIDVESLACRRVHHHRARVVRDAWRAGSNCDAR